jgi:molecular chaperone GrpE
MSDTENTKKTDDVNVNGDDQASKEELLDAASDTAVSEPAADALISEWKSKAAYMAAELDNVKKRFMRERVETIKFANESLLKLVVPVLDNLNLALSSAKGAKEDEGSSPMLKGLVEGVEMTLKHFEQTLAQAGVEFIDAEGKEFDPEVHEAVGQAQDASHKDGVVINQVQRGFKLSGRVARTAKVIVNKTA